MNTVFIGGSRHVPLLPGVARNRVNDVIEQGLDIMVGDANGIDKAVQKHLADARYDRVTVIVPAILAATTSEGGRYVASRRTGAERTSTSMPPKTVSWRSKLNSA